MAENTLENPTLYKFYGKDYDYNSLKKELDANLDNYIYGLKRGKKDYDKFIETYDNLMAGLKSRDIYYDTDKGKFIDKKYGYTNYDDVHKDYVGLLAKYIYDGMNSQSPYEKPKDPNEIDYAPGILEKDLSTKLFGSASPSSLLWKAWLDRDMLDDKGIRGINNRYLYVLALLNALLENTYSNYNDVDKKRNTEQLNAIINLFNNNNKLELSPDEYSEWLKLFPNIDPYKLFSTDKEYSDNISSQAGNTPNEYDLFNTWMNENNYLDPGTINEVLADYSDIFNRYNANDLNTLSNLFASGQTDLYNILNTALFNPDNINSWNYKGVDYGARPIAAIILNYLKNNNKGLTRLSDGKYYINNSWEKGSPTGLVFDSNKGTVSKVDYWSIAPIRESIMTQYQTATPGASNYWWSRSYKKGGIIKAKEGWYANLEDYNGTYDSSYDTSKLYAGDLRGDSPMAAWASQTAGNLSGTYTPTEHGTLGVGNEHYNYVLGFEGEQYYKDFINSLFNEDGSLSDIGLAWAKATDDLLPTDSVARIFDANGNVRNAWTLQGKDAHDRDLKSYTSLRDYVTDKMKDQLLGGRHNIFVKRGKKYYYKDDQGVKHYVDPSIIGNYKLKDTIDPEYWDKDNLTFWEEQELIGLKDDPLGENDQESGDQELGDSTAFRGRGEDKGDGDKKLSLISSRLERQFPNFLNSTRLLLSLRANHLIAKTLKQSLTPALLHPYENLYAVTGDFGAVGQSHNLAGSTRNLYSNIQTSDASLYLASLYEGNRLANLYILQGELTDNKEMQRTLGESIKRHEDKQARGNLIANTNRLSLANHREKIGLYDAQAQQANYNSFDTYMKEQIGDWNEKFKEKDAIRLNNISKILMSKYEMAINALLQKFENAHKGEDDYIITEDPNFTKAVSQYRARFEYELSNSTLNDTNNFWEDEIPLDYDKLLLSVKVKRQGGKLSLTSSYLINKVINNESNT